MITETVVIKKERKDLIADICFKENSFYNDSTDSNAMPKPPLKYPPYVLTRLNPIFLRSLRRLKIGFDLEKD